MMKQKEKFKLFANCILVKGAKRIVICDLQRQDIFFINTPLYQILTGFSEYSPEDIKANLDYKYNEFVNKSFQFLIDNDLGFFSTEHDNFPNIDLKWDYPGQISNAIIEIDSESDYDMIKLFNSIQQLGCKWIQLRFYDKIEEEKLVEYLEYLNHSSIRNIEMYIPISYFSFELKPFLVK